MVLVFLFHRESPVFAKLFVLLFTGVQHCQQGEGALFWICIRIWIYLQLLFWICSWLQVKPTAPQKGSFSAQITEVTHFHESAW